MAPASRRRYGLLSFDDRVRGRHFDPHQAVVAVEENLNLQVRRDDAQGFVIPAARRLLSEQLHGNASRNHVLRDQYRKRLLASGLPVIHSCKHAELIIEVVIQHGDVRR